MISSNSILHLLVVQNTMENVTLSFFHRKLTVHHQNKINKEHKWVWLTGVDPRCDPQRLRNNFPDLQPLNFHRQNGLIM